MTDADIIIPREVAAMINISVRSFSSIVKVGVDAMPTRKTIRRIPYPRCLEKKNERN